MKRAATIVGVFIFGAAGLAGADVAAVWAEGQGGIDSTPGAAVSNVPALGFRLGARATVFEGYLDHTGLGDGAAVTRGIFGLRGGFGSGDTRLVLRAGAGILDEEGGAVTGRLAGTPERRGAVARVGGAVETRLSSDFLMGLGIDGESFILPNGGGTISTGGGRVMGSDLFANLHLTFELGI